MLTHSSAVGFPGDSSPFRGFAPMFSRSDSLVVSRTVSSCMRRNTGSLGYHWLMRPLAAMTGSANMPASSMGRRLGCTASVIRVSTASHMSLTAGVPDRRWMPVVRSAPARLPGSHRVCPAAWPTHNRSVSAGRSVSRGGSVPTGRSMPRTSVSAASVSMVIRIIVS